MHWYWLLFTILFSYYCLTSSEYVISHSLMSLSVWSLHAKFSVFDRGLRIFIVSLPVLIENCVVYANIEPVAYNHRHWFERMYNFLRLI